MDFDSPHTGLILEELRHYETWLETRLSWVRDTIRVLSAEVPRQNTRPYLGMKAPEAVAAHLRAQGITDLVPLEPIAPEIIAGGAGDKDGKLLSSLSGAGARRSISSQLRDSGEDYGVSYVANGRKKLVQLR